MENPAGSSGSAPMGGGDEKQASGSGGARTGMLAVNDLNYVLAPDLSVSVNNTFKNHYFQSNEYTDTQRGICILNSGADYGDMRSSTLNFHVQLTGNPGRTGYFGKNGSALNLIRQITISSRSGDEISRVSDLNHLAATTLGYKYSQNWIRTVGQAMGYGGFVPPSEQKQELKDQNYTLQMFSIPLYVLSDFFAYGRLMPAMVLAGLRIEIEWENPAIAMQIINSENPTSVAPGTAITGFKIVHPYISLRSVQLTDGTQRALNEMSAVNGLEIVYCDHERTEQFIRDSTLHLEVRKAASRALKAYLSVRPKDNVTGTTAQGGADSFRTEPWDVVQWQWQLGSLYFPQQPIKALNGKPQACLPESYQHTLVCFNTYKGDQPRCSAVALNDNEHVHSKEIGLRRWEPTTNDIQTDGAGEITSIDGTALGTLTLGDTMVVDNQGAITSHTIVGWYEASGFPYSDVPFPVNLGVGNVPDGNFYVVSGLNNARTTPWAAYASTRDNEIVNYDGQSGTFANGRSTICCLLERSDLFNLTGVPINNSRVLAAHVHFKDSKDRVCTIFLKYVRLARVFLNNVEVEQ